MRDVTQYLLLITLTADIVMAAYLMLQTWRDRK